MTTYTISEVVKLTGLSSATLRYYEKQALIAPIGRHGLKRVYQKDTLTRLSLILLAKQAQFSLKEIATMVGHMDQGLNRPFIRAKIADIDAKIQELTQLKTSLTHIHNCPEENHFDCPSFQNSLQKAVAQHKAKPLP